jgi:hypothetical protein
MSFRRNFAKAVPSSSATNVRYVFAKCGGQIDSVILLVYQDLADLFRHGKFAERFALANAVTVLANGLVFVFEIEPKHVLWLVRGPHRLGSV